jgi:ACS family tartrate transporter-like MFS transporter
VSELESAVATVRRRLIPFLFLLYIVSYLDRINLGFASLQMNPALGLSDAVYGFGSGLFFPGYVLFEIPSNVILARVGARRWIARIMISWGFVSAAMIFVRSAPGFYALRFALGVAEAGFFPGIIYYLTRWVPARERARTIAAFMTATLVAGIIGGPLSGAILTLHGAGLAGWQWLFLLEGLPAVVLGFVVLFVLVDRPEEARWLTDAQKAALVSALRSEALTARSAGATTSAALMNGRIWLLAVVYFTIPVALYGYAFWLPRIIQQEAGGSISDFQVNLLSAVPYIVGSIAMVVAGRHSDRTAERRWHTAIGAAVCGAGLTATAFVHGLAPAMLTLSIAMLGLASMFGPFWTFATSFVNGVGAAAGIALINSVGNVGGFVGPYLLGYIRQTTQGFGIGLMIIGGIVIVGGSLVLLLSEPSAAPELEPRVTGR